MRGVAASLLLVLVGGCAWFRDPPPPPMIAVNAPLPPQEPAADADSLASAPGDSLDGGGTADDGAALPDSLTGFEAVEPPPGVDPETVEDTDDEWRIGGGKTSVADEGGEQVLRMENPLILHRDMSLAAVDGIYFMDRRLLRLTDDVTFNNPDFTGLADRAVYDRNEGRLQADGNVEIQGDSLYVTGPHLDYDRERDVARLSGGVQAWQGERELESAIMTWDRNAETLRLERNASVRDPAQRSRVTGDDILYRLETGWATVTGDPMLVAGMGPSGAMRVTGDVIELDEAGEATASGNVEVRRGFITGYSDSAAFHRDEGYAELIGNPRVEEPNGALLGDVLYLRFNEEEVLERVDVEGNAFLRYAPTDSSKRGESSTVEGDALTMYFSESRAESIRVYGNATSLYVPAPSAEDDSGVNTAAGDTIVIVLGEDGVERVSVLGGAGGVYSFGGAPPDTAAADTAAVEPEPAPEPELPPLPPADGDSLLAPADTAAVDSVAYGGAAADSLLRSGAETVRYTANDVSFVLGERKVILEGNAVVDYGTLNLKAGRIVFHLDEKYLEAEQDPVLSDTGPGVGQTIAGTRMDYNLDAKEGTIDGGRTDSDEGFIYANRLRQVGDGDFLARSGNTTSCALAEEGEDPHFHFGAQKMRIYLGDKVVAKPVTLYIRDIPVFALPYYVFSIRKGRHSGFLTPSIGYGISGANSRFVNNFGYYWATNDYMDFTFSLDYQQQPSRFVGGVLWNYKVNKYLMDGRLNFRQRLESGGQQRDVTAEHRMTLGAWRTTAAVEFRDANFRREEPLTGNIGQTVDRIIENDLSLSRSFGFGGSFSLTFNRREDLDAPSGALGTENILRETLPRYSFSVNSRPLGRKATEEQDGFLPFLSTTQIRFSSNGSRARTVDGLTAVDTSGAVPDTVFTEMTETNTRATHTLSLTDTRKLGTVLNIGPSFNATEHWVDREFTPDGEEKGFHRAATWSAGINAGTTLYGQWPGLGPVQAVRHTFQPNASFTYSPEFESLTYVDSTGTRRSRYPGVGASERQFLNLSADNRFQAKVGSGADVQRLDLFNLGLRASYDLLAKERGQQGWSNVFANLNLRQIAGVTLNFNSEHETYEQFRFRSYRMTGAFSLGGVLPGADAGVAAGGANRQLAQNDLTAQGGQVREIGQQGSSPAESRALTWNTSFSFSVNGSRQIDDSFDTRTTLNSTLSLQLTKNWGVSYRNAWRISEGEVVGESFTLRRDLHCWEAAFEGNRVGDNVTFYIRINIKDLPDIKVEQGRQGSQVGGLSNFLP